MNATSGRTRPRTTLLDLALIAVVIAAAGFGVAAYRRFQIPPPTVSSVSPLRVPPGTNRRLTIRGEHFEPFLHILVTPSGRPFRMEMIDRLAQEARIVAVTATEAEVTLPEVSAGPHDLYVFDEFQQVAVVQNAFIVAAPVYPRATMTATVRFLVYPSVAALFKAGERDASVPVDPDVPAGEGALVAGVRLDPALREELEMRLAQHFPGDGYIWMGNRSAKQQVDLELQVPLVMDVPGVWRYKGARLRAGELMPFASARLAAQGLIVHVGDPEPLDRTGATQP